MKKGVLYTAGSIIILIICLLAFVMPSTLGNSKAQEGLVFGKYNNKKISYEYGSDFSEFISHYAEMFRNQGMQIDSSTQYYIFNYAFNSTVMKYAYEDAVRKTGWEVPKEAINRRMRPYFYDENGKFSTRIYNQTDSASIEKLRADIETELFSSRFYDDNFGSQSDIFGTEALFGIKESDSELDFLVAYQNDKRGFNMAAMKKSDYPEEEQLKYANQNKAKFIKYDMSVITVEDKATAEKIVKRITKGEISFEDAIAEYSEKTYSNSEGKLNNNYQYQIENLLEDKADLEKIVTVAKDGTSPIINTLIGFSIFRADGEAEQPDFTKDDMKAKVSSYINAYEATIVEDYFTAKAKDFTAEVMKSSFDAACEKFDIENTSVAAFPLNFGSTTISQSVDTSIAGLRGADKNENFLKTAFALKLNEVSAPIVMNDYVIVLQYTNNESIAEAKEAPYILTQLEDYDSEAAQNAIMDSPKLENNFASTYYGNLM
ncbi:MAG: SurA N-terminal domain-containing protein [Treponema sp.]|nr:SurA N-terminal domain-containing protein [Treponema sp.]